MSRLTAEATASTPGGPVILRVAGSLDVQTAPMLDGAFVACLSGEPDVVVLDLTDVTDAADEAIAGLRTMSDRASAWPGTAVVVGGPSPAVRAALDRSGVARYVHSFPTVPAALEGWGLAEPDPPRLRLGLPPTVSAASTARRLVDRACHQWGLPGLRDTARLIATELVSNAVRHAITPLEVTLSCHGDAVFICVRDRSPVIPQRGDPVPPTVEGGRGLIVVDLMSRAWGTTPTRDGKVVWASLAAR